MTRERDDRPSALEQAAELVLARVRRELDRAFDPGVVDGVALVVSPSSTAAIRVRYLDRSTAADVLLELGERAEEPSLKQLAARLLARPPSPPGVLLCAVAGPELSSLHELPRPTGAPERVSVARATAAIAALCLSRRGLVTPVEAPQTAFAVRAHRCNICSAWALALDEIGVDLDEHTAPNAGRAAVHKRGRLALCDACLRDHREIADVARDELGLSAAQSAEAMTPRAVLAQLPELRARGFLR